MCCSAMGGGGSSGEASGLRGARAPASAVAGAGAAARAAAIEKRVKRFVPARQVDKDVREAPRLELCLVPGIKKHF